MIEVWLPLLLSILIPIAIVALLVKYMNIKKYIYSKRVYRVLVGYISILLIGAGLVAILPVDKITYGKIVHSDDFGKESSELYDAAIEGRMEQVDPAFIIKKWTFKYPEQELNLKFENEGYFNTQIIIERKNTNDGKIDAVFYKSRSIVNDRDVTGLTKPIRMELTENTLLLMNPKFVKIEFSEFGNVFSVAQFTGESWLIQNSSFFEGQSILYLQIPKDLQLVEKSYLNIQFVE